MDERVKPEVAAVALPLPRWRKGGGVPRPRFVQIEPVGECNLRCRMCPIEYRRDGRPWGPAAFIDFDAFRRLVDGFPEMEELQLQGLGEPMLHPRFFDMVAYAARRGVRVSTNSNLTLLTPKRATLCVTSGLAALHASIDGATAASYEYIRRGANFAKLLRNLDRLVAAKSQTASATPQLRIVTVAMRRNLDELADIVALAHAHGVPAVFVQHLCHDYGESGLPQAYAAMRDFFAAESLLDADASHVAAAFGTARRRAEELGVDLRLPPLTAAEPRRNEGHGCDWPRRGAYLSYRGDAMPCCMVSTPDRANLGNMTQQGVDTVWNGPAYRAFRSALESDEPPAVCRGCAIYNGTF
ncbi:MAG: SPASM domain-containing protein [Ignavibacteria bacterium]